MNTSTRADEHRRADGGTGPGVIVRTTARDQLKGSQPSLATPRLHQLRPSYVHNPPLAVEARVVFLSHGSVLLSC